ncbi:hypothetical protein G6F17_004173 [Rhizopus arrhizus]|nr:hypothetical protein G6F21_003056 [Rhizopus arrhizus]KAG0827292.1 hypothetical protein G6F18_009556 [Rhizopus arrhizus]KAG0856899.1 hypothetical protein G6F17_004173 [Rhizopus arrhizus]
MKIYICTVFLAFLAQSVFGSYYITNPIQGTSFKAGTNVTISWLNGTSDITTVYLLTGLNPKTMQLTGISFNVDGDAGNYSWKVPTNLSQNAIYSFMFSYSTSNGSTETSYSSSFNITGGTNSINSSAISYAAPSGSSTIQQHSTVIMTTAASSTHSAVTTASGTHLATQLASTTPNPVASSASAYKTPSIVFLVALVPLFL